MKNWGNAYSIYNFVYIIPLCGNVGQFYLKKLLVFAKLPVRQNSLR